MAFIGKNSVTVTSLDSAESMSVVTDLTVDTNTLKVDSVSNRVGILNATPSVSLDIGTATDAIHIPVGTTGERPGSPTSGLFRYNTSLNQFEGYTSTWGAIGGGGTNTFTHDSFTGDNSTTDFVLSQATESENNLFVFIDGVFQTQDAYSIATNSGITTLTLSAAPAQDRKIIVYTVAAGVSGNNLNQNLFDANTSDAVDGVNDTFTLSIPPVNKNNTQVFFDGVYQHKANYSVSGTSLTFTDAPPLGVVVEVMIFTQTAVNVPVDNSVTSSKLSGDLVAPGNLTVTGYLAGPSTFILDPSAVGDNTGTLLVKGNLQVDGIQTIINSTTLTVDDLNITLASGAANALAADGAGITIDTGSDPDATITYDGVNDRWNFNKNVDVTGTLVSDGLTVDGTPVRFVSTAPMLYFMESGVTDSNHRLRQNFGNFVIQKLSDDEGTATDRLLIDGGTGDISFYDTSANQAFFWDASAASLGIGTSSPASELHVKSSGISSDTLTIENSTGNGSWRVKEGGSSNALLQGYNASNSETIRLDPTSDTFFNGGNVGIGTNVPTHKLEIRNDVLASTDLEPTSIKLYNNSDGGSAIEFSNAVAGKSKISFGVESTGAGTDETYLGFSTAANAGSLTERMRIGSGGVIVTYPSAGGIFVINEDGNDADFRVESVNNENMLFVDGGANKVGIGTNSLGRVFNVYDPATDGAIKLETGGNASNIWAGIEFKTPSAQSFIYVPSNDSTGLIKFLPAASEVLALSNSAVVVNETGSNVDFRVESVNDSSMLFVDASADSVNIGAQKFAATPTSTDNDFVHFNTGATLVNQDSSATVNLFHRSASGTAVSCTGTVFVACEASGQNVSWGYIIDFFYNNNVFTSTARETGSSQGTTTCSVQENGTAISVSVAYTSGLGGNLRFNAGGHAVVCNY